MPEERKKSYPIEAIHKACGNDVWVWWSKTKEKEYLTETKVYNNWHKCPKNNRDSEWLPRGAIYENQGEKDDRRQWDEAPTPEPFEEKAEGSIPVTGSQPTFKGSGIDIERIGGKITKIFFYREMKKWGGDQQGGSTDAINAGAQMELDPHLDTSPEEAFKSLGDYVTKEIKRRLGNE